MRKRSGESEVAISVMVSRGMAAHLKRLAWQACVFEMKQVSVSGLVRAAIHKVYGGQLDAPAEPAVQPQGPQPV